MKVIVPCGGRSSRYPNQPPKWMLPSHDGRPMLALAVSGIQIAKEDLVITILREHEETYRVRQGLEAAFGQPIRVVVLEEPTRSQPETVAKTLEALALDEPFLVKDSDNTFVVDDVLQDTNYVCVDSLNNYDQINPRNKSYLQVDHKGLITNIREKVVISDLFSVGGYSFLHPSQFLEYYKSLSRHTAEWQRELYVSDIIGSMILDGIPFRARQIKGYQDWGTIIEWRRALLSRKTYFVLLDGFVFERGSEHFHPPFSEVAANPQAVEALTELVSRGHTIIYLSIRPASCAELTERKLAELGLPTSRVVYNCPMSTWVMLTAPHSTLPFQTGHALELQPDDPNLLGKLALET
jgi:GTP:adenosylcobinamide-phosphate guanylyltransferase